MKIKCEYCGGYISDTDEKCENCGATNPHLKRVGNEIPKTIDELKKWYTDHNLPDEKVTRFFIGKNYKEKRAFGIFYDEVSGNYVVYKNKDDGSRAIRYEGKDQTYAVNELYLKLKEEIQNQKNNNIRKNNNDKKTIIVVFIIIAIASLIIVISLLIPGRGYYFYNNDAYYYQNGSWYQYDNYEGWYKSKAPRELKRNYSDYYNSDYYDYSYGIDDFSNSDYYEEPNSNSSWDSGSSWDSDSSWDSGSSDWDSDW